MGWGAWLPSTPLAKALLGFLLVGIGGCEHPIAIVTSHVEVADLQLRGLDGELLGSTLANRSWSVEGIELQDGNALGIRFTLLDFRGEPVKLEGRSDITFRMEAEDSALLQWEPLTHHGWIRTFGSGATRVRFLVWHQTHADFVTPWLPVVILPPGGQVAGNLGGTQVPSSRTSTQDGPTP